MKIIFFGLGSVGQRHINILSKKSGCDLYAFRSDKSHSLTPVVVKEIFSWREFDKIKPSVAFITNPTVFHIKTATRCAERGCHLFIEKPLGSNLTGLNNLIKIVKERKISTFVAYNLRFHPVINALKKYVDKYRFLHLRAVCTSFLPLWRPGQNYKTNYSAARALGGGVILDLSHEIDYVGYLLGGVKKISGNFSKRSNLTKDTEDFADLLVDGKSGPANIHLSFLSQIRQRTVQIDFQGLSVLGDLENFEIKEYMNEKLAKTYRFPLDRELSYNAEIDYFLKNLENPKMINNIFDASKLFKKIIEFKENNYE